MRTPRRVTYFKRRGTLLKKVRELCGLTGARAAVIVLSSRGRLHFSGGSSVEEMEEISFDYVRRNGGAMPPMGPKERWEWIKKRRQPPEIAKIPDRGRLRRSFLNRLSTIIKMTYGLCTVTDARAAVVVFSDTGFHYLFGSSSFENIIFDWVKKQRESCETGEDFDSLNSKYEAVLHYVREKLKDISGGGNSGVGAGCDSEGLNDDNFNSPLKILKACCEALSDLFKEYVSDGLLTSPVNSAFASGSSGNEPMRSVFVGREFNPHSSLNLTSVNAGAGGHFGVGVGHNYDVLNDDETNWILSLLADNGNCNRNGDSDSFLTSPVNLAAGGGSSGVEPTPMSSDLGDCESDPNKYLNLSEDFVRDGFLISPEKSTFDGGSSGEEPPRSDLEGCGYDPDVFSTLEELDVSLEI